MPDGVGIADVRIMMEVNKSGVSQLVTTTDSDGDYKNYVDLANNTIVRVWAEKPGYSFDPPTYDWMQLSGPEDRLMNFSAVSSPATSTPTIPPPRQSPTPTRGR
jgi:hypothetical protein